MSNIIYCNYDKIELALKEDNVYYITDKNIERIYGSFGARGISIDAGEDSKSLTMVETVALDMVDKGCNRDTKIIAVGGGVVGDLAGFIAAVYMRGIEWVNIPTTLLSQVDSSVGGKTAVDLHDYKNIIGAFHLPTDVYICSKWLDTLPEREWRCGLGEIVKTAFLDKKIYELLTKKLDALKSRDGGTVHKFVKNCISFKSKIVKLDFNEMGLRKILNLGHTLGHALEKVDRHILSHGEYVLQGLALEAKLFKDEIDPGYYHSLISVVKSIIDVPQVDFEAIAEAALKDKKNSNGKITIIISPNVGKYEERVVSKEELIGRYNNIR